MSEDQAIVTFAEADFRRLYAHLFPGDDDEHGAVLHAGIVQTDAGLRLVVRDVVLAEPGCDYVSGKIGYRALQPSFIHRQITRCRDQGLAYLAVHNHASVDSVDFSCVDLQSHERGYPALLDIGGGVPVGALVFGHRAAQADIWLPDERRLGLSELRVVGERLERLYPRPRRTGLAGDSFDRQVRMFGGAGQALLRDAKVAVIGLGGVGSIVSEYLARLGVGHLVLVDPDRVEESNLSRLVGATSADAAERRLKVEIAARHASEMREDLLLTVVDEDVARASVARLLRDCDFVFLAADSMRARLVVNALAHQYFLPVAQLGAKVRPGPDGSLEDAMSAVRLVTPGHACLWCNQLIDPNRLALEAKTEEERRAQAYGVEEPNPSVISLNAVSAAHAVNDFLFYFLGLTREPAPPFQHFHFVQSVVRRVLPRRDPECRECSRSGRFGKGDSAELPCLAG